MNTLEQKELSFDKLLLKLDKSGEGYLAIIDNEGKLIGLVTDGDVRRAILNKQSSIEEIINYQPKTINEGISKSKAITYLKKKRLRHLPVVNNNRVLIDVIKLDNWDDIYRKNKVVIMAGGIGSRLQELTKDVPKPMLPLGNKPILEHIILNFMQQGFLDFIISVNYKSEVIKDYFKDGNQLGVNIEYVEERERKGTAGALSLIKTKLSEPFFVINGDIVTALDFTILLKEHEESNAMATMCLINKSHRNQYGVVSLDEENNLIEIKEKPLTEFKINAGIYVLNPEVLIHVPSDEYFDMTSLFEVLKKDKCSVKGFTISDYWKDIGLKEEYYQVFKEIENKPI